MNRVVTFEGLLGQSNQSKVYSTYIVKEIEQACQQIQSKLAQSDVVITQAIFYFKVKKSKLYLTGAQNIHVVNEFHRSKVAFDKTVVMSVAEEQL